MEATKHVLTCIKTHRNTGRSHQNTENKSGEDAPKCGFSDFSDIFRISALRCRPAALRRDFGEFLGISKDFRDFCVIFALPGLKMIGSGARRVVGGPYRS